jgi:Predicted ester cyclase
VSVDENKAAVRRYVEEAVNGSNTDVVPQFFHDDVVFFDPFTQGGMGQGIKAMTDFMIATKVAFPDFRFTVEDLWGEGDLATWRGLADGTHEGEFPGLPKPTGRKIHIPMCQVMKFENGKIKQMWVFTDSLGLASQVGAFG